MKKFFSILALLLTMVMCLGVVACGGTPGGSTGGSGSGSGGSGNSNGGSGVDMSGYNWYIRYSAYDDGTDFSAEYKDGYDYIGIAYLEEESFDKQDYEWTKINKETPGVNKNIKVLAIGNSFSDDATEYLWDIFKDAGYNATVANMYIGGCSLNTHWSNMQSGAAAYEYRKNTAGVKNTTTSVSLNTAIKDEDWDVITIQQASGDSGQVGTYGNLESIIGWINSNKTNPNAKIYWHMTWAYQYYIDGTDVTAHHSAFTNYGSDQMQMYNAIVNATRTKVLPNEEVVGVIPSGTSIQNLRTSTLGDTLTRDGYHLSWHAGRYAAALTYFATITGEDVESINYLPKLPTYQIADVNGVASAMTKIKESVKNAIENPYAVTNCKDAVKAVNYVAMDQTDIDILEGQGKNASDYLKVDLEWTNNAYYQASLVNAFNKITDNATLSPIFNCTRVFDKEDLPEGTLIYLENGYKYRPEGFYAYNGDLLDASRAQPVSTAGVFEIDYIWQAKYNFRAFNLSKIDASATSASDNGALRIYVPRDMVNA